MDAGSFVIALLAAAGTAAGPTGPPAAAAPAPRCIAAPPVGSTDPTERRLAAAGPLDTGTADDRSTGRPSSGSGLLDAADALEQLAAALRADAARADPGRQTDDGDGATGLADELDALDELDADRRGGVGADRTDASLRDRLSDDRLGDPSLDREGLDGTALDPDQSDLNQSDLNQSDLDRGTAAGSRAAEVDGQGRLDDDLLVARVVDQLADRLAEEESPACGNAGGAERSSRTDDDLGATAPGRGQGTGRADPGTGTDSRTGTDTSSADRQQDDRGAGSRVPTDLDGVLARSAAERERAEESGISAALDRGERGTG